MLEAWPLRLPSHEGVCGGRLVGRQLEKWEPPKEAVGPNKALALGDMRDYGRPWDQFRENKNRYGVKTSFDESLYTTVLDKSSFTRSQIEGSDRLVREIRNRPRSRPASLAGASAHLAEERGQDVPDVRPPIPPSFRPAVTVLPRLAPIGRPQRSKLTVKLSISNRPWQQTRTLVLASFDLVWPVPLLPAIRSFLRVDESWLGVHCACHL